MSKNNTKLFDKVLIANRGEIACRVMHTCRKMGIKTVAVHSTADSQAKHVRMADESVCIGPPASKESYLRVDAVMDAVHKTKANAVHPGYGFLSENANFSAELKKNDVVFIGPDAKSIDAMGNKIHAKNIAKNAKVNIIPGSKGAVDSADHLLQLTKEIGYPVMVKAADGGGGKGMRVAYNDKEAVEAYTLCKEEAMASFSSDELLVERFVDKPRHIEIQVIADRCGNTLYLPERECSIQRRNQKVIEEAPSSFIDPKTRKLMGEQAVMLARAVDYVSAGTVEMMVDGTKNFYFLEMNTRLQVEHPITEEITRVDLVEQMIRAAAGVPLSIKQEDISIHGWATECRVYAEDPLKNYFPSIGRLSRYVEPTGDGVRVESGILEGSQISVYYDPLISKLVTHGKDREESITRMEQALDAYVIRGLNHNVCLLRDVLGNKVYRSGNFTTKFLDEQYPDGFKGMQLSEDHLKRLASAGAMMRWMQLMNDGLVSGQIKPLKPCDGERTFIIADDKFKKQYKVRLSRSRSAHNKWNVTVDNDETVEVTFDWAVDMPVSHITYPGLPTENVQYFGTNQLNIQLQFYGSHFHFFVLSEKEAELFLYMPEKKIVDMSQFLLAPMPGAIIDILVNVGDKVVRHQPLVTLEAMKMRNKLKAEKDGVVKKINVKAGDTVADEQIIIEFE